MHECIIHWIEWHHESWWCFSCCCCCWEKKKKQHSVRLVHTRVILFLFFIVSPRYAQGDDESCLNGILMPGRITIALFSCVATTVGRFFYDNRIYPNPQSWWMVASSSSSPINGNISYVNIEHWTEKRKKQFIVPTWPYFEENKNLLACSRHKLFY